MTPHPPNTSASGRLDGLDLARFAALVGMVIVNFSIVMGAEGGDGWAAAFTASLSGRAAATFVVLAGIGLGLAHSRSAGPASPWLTVRRAAFLAVCGLLNMLVFPADILHYYAVYFLFGAWLVTLGNRALVTTLVGVNGVFLGMLFTLNYDAGWDWSDYSYTGFWTVTGFFRNLFFNGWHPVFPWLGFLAFGILLSRARLAERATQWRLAVVGAVVLIAVTLFSRLATGPVSEIDTELGFLVSTEPVPPMPLYTLAGLGAASCAIGVCLLLAPVLSRWGGLALLVPAGRQTLTLYIAHVIIGMGTLEVLGMLGGQTATLALMASAVFCCAATVYAWCWSRRFKRGPLEALMRATAG